ncbi:MAG: DnaJ domain-containing protein [Alphaproteobacteria bacterium]|nr:DnaJ domain-containing protein [Alphaproteobacteria bacterium]
MRDPYSVLGVPKSASDADLKAAFRKLAKTHHPDAVGGNNKEAMQRFQEITAAYDLLTDPEKRRAYDRGLIDANGQPKAFTGAPFSTDGGGGPRREFRFEADMGNGGDDERVRFEDLFGDIFGGAFRQKRARPKGPDLSFDVEISLEEAVSGATRRVSLPDGRMLDVKIPAGVDEGQQVRLRGQGEPSRAGGEAGDALVTIAIAKHPLFRREGRDVHLSLPITLGEAVMGGKIEVPTLGGSVTMTIPSNANSGLVLRLKGKGMPAKGKVPAGDQYVTLMITLPDEPDTNLTAFVKRWATGVAYDPRAKLKRG